MAALDPKPGAVVYQSDTLSLLSRLPSGSCDVCYTNPPFAITNAKWDQALPWDALWPQIWRVLKPKGVVVLHCSMPFTYDLILSQRQHLRYSYVWKKNNSTGHLHA